MSGTTMPKLLMFPEAEGLIARACKAAGADQLTTDALAAATLSAHKYYLPEVGIVHLFDYLEAMRSGRINGAARPVMENLFRQLSTSSCTAASLNSVSTWPFTKSLKLLALWVSAYFARRAATPMGVLGYYVRRLADFVARANGDYSRADD